MLTRTTQAVPLYIQTAPSPIALKVTSPVVALVPLRTPFPAPVWATILMAPFSADAGSVTSCAPAILVKKVVASADRFPDVDTTVDA